MARSSIAWMVRRADSRAEEVGRVLMCERMSVEGEMERADLFRVKGRGGG